MLKPSFAGQSTLLSGESLMLALLGICAGVSTLYTAALPTKGLVILVAALLFGLLLVLAGNRREKVVLFSMTFLTSLNLKVHFLADYDHIGGANGLRLSAVFVLMVILFPALLQQNRAQGRRIRIIGWIHYPFLGYITFATFSGLLSDYPLLSIFQITQLIQSYLVFIYFSNRLRTDQDYFLILTAFSIAIALQGGVTVAQKYSSLSTLNFKLLGGAEETMVDMVAGSDMMRFSGMFKHPALLGNFLVLYLPATLGLILFHPAMWVRAGAVFAAVSGFAALILTYSRSSMIVMSICLAAITLLLAYRRVVRLKTFAVLFVFEILVIASILVWKGQDILLRFTRSEEGPVQVRFELADIALSVIRDHPFLGVGINNFTKIVEDYERLTVYVSEFRHPVHNLYLLEFSETGIIGGVCFMLFLAGVAVVAVKALKQPSSIRKYIVIAVSCSYFGYLIQCISEWAFRFPEINTIVFTNIGILGALYMTGHENPVRNERVAADSLICPPIPQG